MRRLLRFATLLSAGLVLSLPSWAAGRLETQGVHFPRQRVEAVMTPALRAPGDSAQLAGSLAALRTAYEGAGYLDARAVALWDSAATPVLHLTVDEGTRFRLVTLTVEAPARADSALLAGGLDLAPGGWASPAAIAAAVEHAVRQAADQGHPYATLGVAAFWWDSTGAHARLQGTVGPLVTVTQIRVEGLHATRPSFVQQSMGKLVGEPFSQSEAVAARDRLARLGLFRTVTYRGLEGDGDWQRGQLVYQVEEVRYNRFEGAVGVQGEAGAVGLASLGLENLAGTGRALGLRWQSLGHGVAQFDARYAEPRLLGTPLRIELALRQDDQDTLYSRTRWGGRIAYAMTERRRIAAGYSQERVVQPVGDVLSADLHITEFSLERDGRDHRLGPRRGSYTKVTASQIFKREQLRVPAERTSHSSAIELAGELHRPLGARSGFALELPAAGRFGSQRILAPYERYPVGGAASLRGHDEQEFWVDRYALSRLEWRWFLGAGEQRVFLFWDHAVMETRVPVVAGGTIAGDRMDVVNADGIGFGLRLDTAGGTVGVDYGVEPGRPPLDGKIHLRLVSAF
jgi:outer membrane protein assembly factor BamA